MKDKEISEEELLDELDTMYQRVADIEKEEAAQETPQTPLTPKIKPKQRRKKRSYRTVIIVASVFFIVLASVLAVTLFDPMALLRNPTALFERLKTGGTEPPPIATPPPPKKHPAVSPSPAAPKPPATVGTSPGPQKPQAAGTSSPAPTPPPVAASPAVQKPSAIAIPARPSPATSLTPPPAPLKPTSELPSVQAKQEALKSPPQGTEKSKRIPQETMLAHKPSPRGRYFAIQVGAFRDMENVRELVEAFKKEGLEATVKSRGGLHRVLVGRFADEDEATAFLKDKNIFEKYPGSFIKEISPSKINR